MLILSHFFLKYPMKMNFHGTFKILGRGEGGSSEHPELPLDLPLLGYLLQRHSQQMYAVFVMKSTDMSSFELIVISLLLYISQQCQMRVELGDNCIQNFRLGRYVVGCMVGNLVLR